MAKPKLTTKNLASLHPLAYNVALGLSQGTLALPLTFQCRSPQEAQHQRCRLYDFRRLLRIATAYAEDQKQGYDLDTFAPLLDALERVESPRIDYNSTGTTDFSIRASGSAPKDQDFMSQLLAQTKPAPTTSHSGTTIQDIVEDDLTIEPSATRTAIHHDDSFEYIFEVPSDDNSSLKMLLMRAKLPNSEIRLISKTPIQDSLV